MEANRVTKSDVDMNYVYIAYRCNVCLPRMLSALLKAMVVNAG